MNETPDKAASQERRRHSRARIKWPVVIQTKEGVVAGKTKNICASGALVYYDRPFSYDQPLREHERFTITIKALNHFPVEIDVEVVWFDIFSSDERSIIYGMGLRFIRISERDRQLITLAASYQREAMENAPREPSAG